LGKYLNVKLTAYIYSRKILACPIVFLFLMWSVWFLVERDDADEHNKLDTSDQPASRESGICTCDREAIHHVDDTSVAQLYS
jgi:hypothetical protein